MSIENNALLECTEAVKLFDYAAVGDLQKTKDLYTEFINLYGKSKYGDIEKLTREDRFYNKICLLMFFYRFGKIEGIREERKRRRK